MDNDSSAL